MGGYRAPSDSRIGGDPTVSTGHECFLNTAVNVLFMVIVVHCVVANDSERIYDTGGICSKTMRWDSICELFITDVDQGMPKEEGSAEIKPFWRCGLRFLVSEVSS